MPPAQAGVASAVISATRQFGSVLGVAVMGDLVTTGVSARHGGRAETHAVALSAATHGAWALAVGCGLVIALTGYLTTTARAHATAAAIAAAAVAPRGARRRRPRHPTLITARSAPAPDGGMYAPAAQSTWLARQLGQQARLLGRVEPLRSPGRRGPGPRRGCRGSSR